jgi:hypothetical protein
MMERRFRLPGPTKAANIDKGGGTRRLAVDAGHLLGLKSMKDAHRDPEEHQSEAGVVHVYCLTSLIAEEARRFGLKTVVAEVERVMDRLLASMTDSQQRTALLLSCELAQAPQPNAESPRLRLVVSHG